MNPDIAKKEPAADDRGGFFFSGLKFRENQSQFSLVTVLRSPTSFSFVTVLLEQPSECSRRSTVVEELLGERSTTTRSGASRSITVVWAMAPEAPASVRTAAAARRDLRMTILRLG
ncbi:hypothetical protein Mext_3087 [Methylorubrum extorquens PA1]|nr:hypothetical protein Mext_3087 [Methylorubrum extorquens PA1]